ncbi:RagB/SusD family nutrient uptake outer membrane protein [Bacteroides thetaiotaomicron]|uniref:RagB/SusD family nutrient uptake outer membrane protein n=1 Tax=Bacteroides thetaiotaomicron TaxID=818 RepID=UPI002166AF31|nr:RagB/SusD family nutrient uptake outer membrane protein [Bacteroides thetaiotaomicron]MCS2829311.1 RagB/SusD family nutrient uptake outer membrane protein [Bacteroides thetaiotaomicron]
MKYINLVRERSGLNARTAYPEVKGTGLVADADSKERMVELAFEGHRYYDARRWMIAQQSFPDRNILLIYWPLHTKILGRGHQMFGKVVLGYLSLSIISSLSIKNNCGNEGILPTITDGKYICNGYKYEKT